jgi:hypothetical protein
MLLIHLRREREGDEKEKVSDPGNAVLLLDIITMKFIVVSLG